MKSTEQTARKVLKCEDCQAKYDNGCNGGICPELEDCIAVAEIQRKMTIDKACEWITQTYLGDYVSISLYLNGGIGYNDKLANDLRKAMEE